MHVETAIRIVFGGLFIGLLFGGYLLFKNFEKLFGRDPAFPSDTPGARSLNKVQVIVIWLHLLAITGGFALWLH